MKTVTFTYTDFDGSTKTRTAEVHEPRPGEFYVQNTSSTAPGGCSKTFSATVHWKPIRSAVTDFLGGRTLISYMVSE